ncbi:MAG TPA: DUF2975 domain-containing protein [Planosporangium sp.]|jgi:hypothetical protein|nr:DUF2975 domain-containing protein [Planosporangium sp.]
MRLSDRLRRPDWLAEVQAVLVAGLVLAAVGAAINVVSLVRREPIVVNVLSERIVPDVGLSGLQPGVHLYDSGTVEVLVDHPTPAQLAWHTAGSLPTFLVVVFMLVTLLRIVRAARRHDPFSSANVRRLRFLGVVVLVGGGIAMIIETIARLALSGSVRTGPPEVGAVVDVSGWWFLVGFGFLAIAEVVNRGRAMRAELETVI